MGSWRAYSIVVKTLGAVMIAFHRRPAIGCHQYMYLQPSRAVAVVALVQSSYPILSENRSGNRAVEKIAHLPPQADGPSWPSGVWQTPSNRSCGAVVGIKPAFERRIWRGPVVVVDLLAIKARFHSRRLVWSRKNCAYISEIS